MIQIFFMVFMDYYGFSGFCLFLVLMVLDECLDFLLIQCNDLLGFKCHNKISNNYWLQYVTTSFLKISTRPNNKRVQELIASFIFTQAFIQKINLVTQICYFRTMRHTHCERCECVN